MPDLPAPFRLINGFTPEEIVDRNSSEFIRWCFVQALTQTDTDLGQKMALLLAKKIIPDKSGQTPLEEKRFFRSLEKIPMSILRKFEAGEISLNEINFSDGQYSVETEEPIVAEPKVQPVAKRAGRPNESSRPSNYRSKS